MILHVVKDDKFIDIIKKIFEAAAPKQNVYAVWQEPNTNIPTLFHNYKIDKSNKLYSVLLKRSKNVQESKYSNSDKPTKVAEFGTKEFFDEIGDISRFKLIIFHSLVYNHAKLSLLLNKNYNIPIIWSPFGYEIYNMLPDFRNEIYQTKTKKYLKKNKSFSDQFFNVLTPLKARIIRKAIIKINYCSISIDKEFQVYKNRINPNLKQFWFTYYPLDVILNNDNVIENAPNILIGNSAFPSNNHLEAFDLLKKHNINIKKIITPLSYGIPQYAKDIQIAGKKLFGNKFEPLTSFLPLEEYNKIIQSCGIVIMNQSRQQAFGNILSSVWFGAKVFLHPDNTIYQYLKNLGINIFSINELEEGKDIILQRLNKNEVLQNRSILKAQYSFNNIVIKTKEMIYDLYK